MGVHERTLCVVVLHQANPLVCFFEDAVVMNCCDHILVIEQQQQQALPSIGILTMIDEARCSAVCGESFCM